MVKNTVPSTDLQRSDNTPTAFGMSRCRAPNDTIAAMLFPRLISPEVAHSFLRILWSDVINQRVPTQTHRQELLKRDAIEIHGKNYAPLMALHWGLTTAVEQRTGKELLPSFAFFRLYFEGDVCRVHADRPACEVSASLTLAYSDERPWVLSIASTPATDGLGVTEDFGGEPFESFLTAPGDAVLYSGSHYRHGRPTPNSNRWSAHIFLQWVSRGGPYEAQAFERLELGERPAVGPTI